jgi:hypothetical protein
VASGADAASTPTPAAVRPAPEGWRWATFFGVAALLVAAVGVSAVLGARHPYPGIALGSGLVLVLERAALLWVGALAALVVLGQAWRGRLPTSIGSQGLGYDAESVGRELDEGRGGIEFLQAKVQDNADLLDELRADVDALIGPGASNRDESPERPGFERPPRTR